MARRSSHAPETLREMILDAAETLIRSGGLSGLSAREIARIIGYSPGTLYNVYANLDDIVLHVEARILDGMLVTLQGVPRNGPPEDVLARLVAAYLAYTEANPRLWNLLFEHHLPAGLETPPWYCEKIERLMGELRGVLAPVVTAHGGDGADVDLAATVLWSSVHGIASLATTGKLANVTRSPAAELAGNLVSRYLAGLRPAA
ncbi:MAG: TetR/AcrR family transcriptional regulator [Hyphomicrobiaceae bacterium]